MSKQALSYIRAADGEIDLPAIGLTLTMPELYFGVALEEDGEPRDGGAGDAPVAVA